MEDKMKKYRCHMNFWQITCHWMTQGELSDSLRQSTEGCNEILEMENEDGITWIANAPEEITPKDFPLLGIKWELIE